MKPLSVRRKILLAAVSLARESATFSAAELVVRAWALYPESFGLDGFSHPDSNAVAAKLAGADGVCGLGWLERVEACRYRVTRRGQQEAARLREELVEADRAERVAAPMPPAAPSRRLPVTMAPLPRPRRQKMTQPLAVSADVAAVIALAEDETLRKFLRGSPLVEADARRFWRVADIESGSERIASIEELLKRAVESFGENGPGLLGLPSLSTCFGLLNVHRLLRARFAGRAEVAACQGVL